MVRWATKSGKNLRQAGEPNDFRFGCGSSEFQLVPFLRFSLLIIQQLLGQTQKQAFISVKTLGFAENFSSFAFGLQLFASRFWKSNAVLNRHLIAKLNNRFWSLLRGPTFK